MARKRLSDTAQFRKATVRAFADDQAKIKAAKEKAAQKAADKDLVGQWRLLRKIGVYETKQTPAAGKLTKSRRAAIQEKFGELQSIGRYEAGEVYRPAHRHDYEKTYTKFDDMGRLVKKTTRKLSRYEIDTDHFQVVKQKPKQLPGGSVKTQKGFIAPKAVNEKIRITKDGKVQHVEIEGAAKTEFTREPLSGPTEFLTLIDDIKAGRLKFKNDEGLALWNNGKRQVYYGQSAIDKLIQRLARYSQNQGVRKFDDWSSNSEIAYIRRR